MLRRDQHGCHRSSEQNSGAEYVAFGEGEELHNPAMVPLQCIENSVCTRRLKLVHGFGLNAKHSKAPRICGYTQYHIERST